MEGKIANWLVLLFIITVIISIWVSIKWLKWQVANIKESIKRFIKRKMKGK